MNILSSFFENMNGLTPLITISLVIIFFIALFKLMFSFFKGKMLQKAKTKAQISNIKIFSRILNILVISLLIIFGFLSYIKSWAGIGVAVGLITAALGLSLQRPITGIAAWIMLIFKRPFNIGDRITIGNFTGDVYDISLTHIYLDEAGILTDSEHHSGRNVMVPNYLLFEQAIINHTLLNDYVINEIEFEIKYGSNIDKAIQIARECTDSLTSKYSEEIKKQTEVRISLKQNTISVKSVYYAPIQKMSQIKTEITKKIYNRIENEKDIYFAYAGTKLSKEKKQRKKRS